MKKRMNPTAEADRLREDFENLVNVVNAINFDKDADITMFALYRRLASLMRPAIKDWLKGLPDQSHWWMEETSELFESVLGIPRSKCADDCWCHSERGTG